MKFFIFRFLINCNGRIFLVTLVFLVSRHFPTCETYCIHQYECIYTYIHTQRPGFHFLTICRWGVVYYTGVIFKSCDRVKFRSRWQQRVCYSSWLCAVDRRALALRTQTPSVCLCVCVGSPRCTEAGATSGDLNAWAATKEAAVAPIYIGDSSICVLDTLAQIIFLCIVYMCIAHTLQCSYMCSKNQIFGKFTTERSSLP